MARVTDRARRRVVRAVVVAALRAVLLVIVFHVSGLAHLAADVFEIATTGHHAGTPFDHDDDDPAQAPGSPSCHHAQPGGASLASPSSIRLGASLVLVLAVTDVRDRAPPSPIQRTLYRPPRA
jgi:hypothetical protein